MTHGIQGGVRSGLLHQRYSPESSEAAQNRSQPPNQQEPGNRSNTLSIVDSTRRLWRLWWICGCFNRTDGNNRNNWQTQSSLPVHRFASRVYDSCACLAPRHRPVISVITHVKFKRSCWSCSRFRSSLGCLKVVSFRDNHGTSSFGRLEHLVELAVRLVSAERTESSGTFLLGRCLCLRPDPAASDSRDDHATVYRTNSSGD